MLKKGLKISIFLIIILSHIYLTVKLFGTKDVLAWVRSAGLTNSYGVVDGFHIYNMAYPPLSSILLWLPGKITNIRSFPSWIKEYPTPAELGLSYIPIKLSFLFFVYALSFILYLYLTKHRKRYLDPWNFNLKYILLNPVFFLGTIILGYLDIYFAPFLLLSLIFFDRRYYFWAGFLLSIAFSIKLLPIFLIPVLISVFIEIKLKKQLIKIDWKNLLMFIIGIGIVVAPIIYFFGYSSLENIFKASAGHGAILSANATNLNLIISRIIQSNNAPEIWITISRLIFYLISFIVIFKLMILKKGVQSVLLSCIFILYTYFIFFTGVHENHLFPAAIVSLAYLLIANNQQSKTIFFHTSTIFSLNLFIYYWLGHYINNGKLIFLGPSNLVTITFWIAPLISLYAIIFYIYLARVLLRSGQKYRHTSK